MHGIPRISFVEKLFEVNWIHFTLYHKALQHIISKLEKNCHGTGNLESRLQFMYMLYLFPKINLFLTQSFVLIMFPYLHVYLWLIYIVYSGGDNSYIFNALFYLCDEI